MTTPPAGTVPPPSVTGLSADLLDQVRSARRRSLAIVCVQCLTVMFAGFIVAFVVALVVGFALGELSSLIWGVSRVRMEAIVFATVGGLFCLFYLPWLAYIALRRQRFVLRQLRARTLTAAEEARSINVVAEAAIAAGVPPPGLSVIDDRAPNGFVVGSRTAPEIVITTGLLEILERDELAAVVGHLVGRTVGGDLRYASLLAGNVAALGYLMQSPALAPAALLCYLPATFETRLISKQRVLLADRVGVTLVRDPVALAAALEKIYHDPNETSGLPADMAMLAFVDPRYPTTMTGPPGLRQRPWSDAKGTALHPPLKVRVDRLRELVP